MTAKDVVERLESLANPDAVEGMARYGITAKKVYGISIPNMRKLAKEIGTDHELALELWKIDSRETRILASMVDDISAVTENQIDSWVEDFDSWEVCDQCIMNLFEKSPFARIKAIEWSSRKEEFVKRAGFVLMARIAVSDKTLTPRRFDMYLPIIKRHSVDERNFVKKAVSWALRQIGKRNRTLHGKAIAVAGQILEIDSKSAHWIAHDVLRELESDAVINRLKD